jgi:hypothetical protein
MEYRKILGNCVKKYEVRKMETETCKTCKHFRQHYIKFGNSYREILYGHCVYPRLKRRESATPACEHYEERT